MSSLSEKVAALEAQQKPKPTFDPDLIPQVGDTSIKRSPEDDDIDRLIDGFPILDAYTRYIGKKVGKGAGKKSEIMVSCPIPGHPDNNPSAWVNTEKRTWFCGACQEGGDLYDLAAIGHGVDRHGYKKNGSFPKLRRLIADDLGYQPRVTSSGNEIIVAPVEGSGNSTEVAGESPSEETSAGGPQPDPSTDATDEHDLDLDVDPSLVARVVIDWRSVVPTGTFLYDWMQEMSKDDLPEEFYFWLGMMMVGLAVGLDAMMTDRITVKGNLFICLMGSSGSGKTRSISMASRLLNEALPYDHDDPDSKGVYHVSSPGSAEALIDSFSKPIFDPTDPKRITGYAGMRGLLRFEELATLIGRAARTGSTMKTCMQDFYDCYAKITHRTRGFGEVEAWNAYCSTVTTTQPGVVRDLLSREDVLSGFLNRWIFVLGRDKPNLAIGGVRLDVSHLVPPLRSLRSWAASTVGGRRIELTDDALARFTEFFHEVLVPAKKDGDDVLSRIDLLVKKVMLLLAINEKSDQITLEHVEHAIKLYDYLEACYVVLGQNLGSSDAKDCLQAIMRCIKKFGPEDGLTTREITRRVTRWDIGFVKKVMDDAESIGLLQIQVVSGKRGRAAQRYRVID